MPETLKIIVPMAGYGSRMRPLTWSKPKPLIAIAGKTVLDYVLEQFSSLPDPEHTEYIFVIGPTGWPVKTFMQEKHPDKKCQYVVQTEMRGQSDALWLAREHLTGPVLMAFADTLIETDLSSLQNESCDGVTWVKPVPDPRRFGVAEVDSEGFVRRLIEKPQDIENNLVVVGFYYFRSGERLITAIEEQMRRDIKLKNEFFLADAVNIMLAEGARFRTERVSVWLDAGVPETVLATNRYLLDHGCGNESEIVQPGVVIIPPVFIHPEASVERAVIGPHVSVGRGCEIRDSLLKNSILDEHVRLVSMNLQDSLIGQNVVLEGQYSRVNLGDNSGFWNG